MAGIDLSTFIWVRHSPDMTAVSAEAQVLRVVEDNNRPYGLQNIVDLTAHLGLKKAAVTKALDSLVEQGKVTAKVNRRC